MNLSQNKKSTRLKIIVLVIFGGIIIIGLIQNSIKEKELKNNRKKTTGVITNFTFLRKTSYELEFRYNVNGETFYNTEITSSFKCEDGTRGCVGKDVKVFYSKEKPEVSKVDLGNYNKYIKKSPSF